MQLIKLTKTVESNTDFIKSVMFVYCYVNNIKLSDSELITLSYFIVYGLNTDTIDLVIKSKILKPDSFKNTLSKLRKYKFIKRVNKTDYLEEEFKLQVDKSIGLLLKIDNEKY